MNFAGVLDKKIWGTKDYTQEDYQGAWKRTSKKATGSETYPSLSSVQKLCIQIYNLKPAGSIEGTTWTWDVICLKAFHQQK